MFGKTTLNSVKDNELIADIVVPSKTASSMSMALDQYIKEANKKESNLLKKKPFFFKKQKIN